MKIIYFLFSVFVFINADSHNWAMDEGMRFEEEKDLASSFGLSGSYPHLYHLPVYHDLSRRFVPNYPYRQKSKSSEEVDNRDNVGHLVPLRASPELVMAVAEESAKLDAFKPKNKINRNILRSGKYWDSFWREDVDPDNILRTKHNKATVNMIPNSELKKLIQSLRLMSPKLIYVINNKR